MRGLGSKILVSLLLGLLLFGAWLTQNPEATLVERATEWPLIGGVARAFRSAYVPPVPAEFSDGEAEIVYLDGHGRPIEGGVRVDPDSTLGARPIVWVGEGTAVLEEPVADAAEVARTGGIANLRILDRRGDWFQVLYRGQPGWVHVEAHEESTTPPLGNDPTPPGPLQARAPDAGRIAFVHELLPSVRQGTLGPYEVYYSGLDSRRLAYFERLVGSLEEVYRTRYTVTPIGVADGAIVFFDRHADFAEYQKSENITHDIRAAGVTGGGVVAVDLEGRLPEQLGATLVHEIAHLLNRRALGPALPPWLEEGLADDLAQSEIAPDGSIETGRIGGVSLQTAGRWEWRGALASAVELRRALDREDVRPLEHLVALDWSEFVRSGESQQNYGQASFWIRHLLSDPTTAVSFRSFLVGVASGGSVEGEELRRRLGADWSLLDERFHRWIKIRFHDPTASTN